MFEIGAFITGAMVQVAIDNKLNIAKNKPPMSYIKQKQPSFCKNCGAKWEITCSYCGTISGGLND